MSAPSKAALKRTELYVLARNVINAWEAGNLMGGISLDYLRDELNRIDPPAKTEEVANMTAEERREPQGSMDVAAYKRAQAKRTVVETIVRKINHSDEVSIRLAASLAYDAGRSAGLEEAAKVVEAYIEARPHTVAAAIRALITAPLKASP